LDKLDELMDRNKLPTDRMKFSAPAWMTGLNVS